MIPNCPEVYVLNEVVHTSVNIFEVKNIWWMVYDFDLYLNEKYMDNFLL